MTTIKLNKKLMQTIGPKRVSPQGQISVGKVYAGQQVIAYLVEVNTQT